MEVVIVEIFIPAINQKIDFKLPSTGRIKDITAELVRILDITEHNVQFDSDVLLLCDTDKGTVLNPSMTVGELQIKDGACLLLV